METRYKIRIKKGDTVIVRSGKYKGKTFDEVRAMECGVQVKDLWPG